MADGSKNVEILARRFFKLLVILFNRKSSKKREEKSWKIFTLKNMMNLCSETKPPTCDASLRCALMASVGCRPEDCSSSTGRRYYRTSRKSLVAQSQWGFSDVYCTYFHAGTLRTKYRRAHFPACSAQRESYSKQTQSDSTSGTSFSPTSI